MSMESMARRTPQPPSCSSSAPCSSPLPGLGLQLGDLLVAQGQGFFQQLGAAGMSLRVL